MKTEIKIKQLEWRPIDHQRIKASSPFWEYGILKSLNDGRYYIYLNDFYINDLPTLKKAKEFAQYEFESKVKECLIF